LPLASQLRCLTVVPDAIRMSSTRNNFICRPGEQEFPTTLF
jgi:hypothetical protein